MRLINAKTYRVEEHEPGSVEYAILSHRWEEEELSFNDIHDDEVSNTRGKATKGWEKLKRFCALAAEYKLEWAWIDTCCIDKSSSAELSEAINSMFRWYEMSTICVAYLFDLSITTGPAHPPLAESDWFRRGWTLQELLAPSQVEFYDCQWRHVGGRKALCQEISQKIHIPASLLYNPREYLLADCSVAQRMSWAAKRTTSREEDRAYSLMGLFDVHMPLLYGEGFLKAFYRLQLEILHNSDDETILCWTRTLALSPLTVIAADPTDFLECSQVRVSRTKTNRKPYSMTNRGLQIELSLRHEVRVVGEEMFQWWCAPLNCTKHGQQLEMILQPHKEDKGPKIRRDELKSPKFHGEWTTDCAIDQSYGDAEGRTFCRMGVRPRLDATDGSKFVRANILIRPSESQIYGVISGFSSQQIAQLEDYRKVVKDIRRELLICPSFNQYSETSIPNIRHFYNQLMFTNLEDLQKFVTAIAATLEVFRKLNMPSDLMEEYKNICVRIFSYAKDKIETNTDQRWPADWKTMEQLNWTQVTHANVATG